MGKNPPASRLAQGEIEILEMLWREGPVSIAAAQTALGLPIGYTTVQTRLNRLVDKGLVKTGRGRPAKYRAAISQEAVSARDLDTLVERVNEGRVVPLVAHLVRDRQLSRSEIEELKQLIAAAERTNRSSSEGNKQ